MAFVVSATSNQRALREVVENFKMAKMAFTNHEICIVFSLILLLDNAYSSTETDESKYDIDFRKMVQEYLTSVNNTLSQPGQEALDEELDKWETPEWILKQFPYFLSGYDDKNRPIWIANWGSFDMRSLVRSGKQKLDLFTKYVEKTVRVIHKSVHIKNSTALPVTQCYFIIDFDGLQLDQLADLNAIAYVLNLLKQHGGIILQGSGQIVALNVNHVANTLIRLAKTVLATVFTKVEIFGTDKAQWIPFLQRTLPRRALPEKYGGYPEHKPLYLYG